VNKRFRPPFRLLIIAVISLVAGLILQSVYSANPEIPGTNVLMNGLPFLLVFVGILLIYIGLIVTVSRYYSGYLPEKRFLPVFTACMIGIVLGILMMFQAFSPTLYTIGFLVLLFSLLSFMIVGHITPRKEQVRSE